MKTISRTELRNLMDMAEDFVLINVLSTDAFLEAHIPNSCNIPISEEGFLRKVEEKTENRSRKIITYCASPRCSASRNAALALEEAGFENVSAYEGGMEDWTEAGYPVAGE